MTLTLCIWAAFAPAGSPENDYFVASVRHGFDPTASAELKAAEKRLMEEGCPKFTSDDDATWDGEKWTVSKKAQTNNL